MSYNHWTTGEEAFNAFRLALDTLGVPYTEAAPSASHGRLLTFKTFGDREMVCEEWLEEKDLDCDGTDFLTIAVYPAGERPELVTEVVA